MVVESLKINFATYNRVFLLKSNHYLNDIRLKKIKKNPVNETILTLLCFILRHSIMLIKKERKISARLRFFFARNDKDKYL